MAVELLNRSGAELIGLGVRRTSTLVLAFEDNAASVAWQVERVKDELRDAEVAVLDAPQAASAWMGLSGFAAMAPGPLSFVASPGRSAAASHVALLPEQWAVRVHAGSGIIHAHAVWMIRDLKTQTAMIDAIEGLRRPSGSMILARCPTEWKDRLKVWGEPRGDWAVMQKIKAALDPGSVLNPGRFVGTI